MLIFIEYFIEAVHGQESDPGHTQLRYDLVCYRGLTAGRPPTHADHKRFNLNKRVCLNEQKSIKVCNLLSLAVIPRRATSCVNCPLRSPDDWLSLRVDGAAGADGSLSLLPGTRQRGLGREKTLIQS